MRKRLAQILIFFAALHCLNLDQLLKLPVLVAHFLEHKDRDNSIRVMDFLSMHYWGHDINDDDDERDRQLPFKAPHPHSFQHICLPALKAIDLQQGEPPLVSYDYPLEKDSHLPNPAVGSLFRPPRA